jgi:flagellum-specific ATP synthase
MGGYRAGSDPALDRAIDVVPRLYDAIRQAPSDPVSIDVFQDIARALSPEPAQSQQRPAGR